MDPNGIILLIVWAGLFVISCHIVAWVISLLFRFLQQYYLIFNKLLKLSKRIGVYLYTVWKRYKKKQVY